MKTFSTKIRRNTRLAYLAFAAVAFSQTGFAQVNDSTLTITGNVATTTCFLRISPGFGPGGTGTGATAATIAAPTVTGGSNTTGFAPGTVLSSISKFTVGLASAAGATGGCTGPASWNTAFTTTGATVTAGGKTLLPVSGTGTGAALELYSYAADGITQTQAIATYPANVNAVTYSGSTNISSQTGLASILPAATQTFGVALVKSAATGTTLGAGTIVGSVTVSYALF